MRIKTQAIYNGLAIIQREDNSIGLEYAHGFVRPKLREIATKIGVEYTEHTNTRILGKRIIDALKG